MKKKLLLVNPKNYSISMGDIKSISDLTKSSGGLLNPSLPTVAALTPVGIDINIVDECIEEVNFDEPCDLVGITGLTTQLTRAKEIANEFRKRGVTVVCGGPSVSVSPERWRKFSDTLIIGEAERIWPQFISDYLAGKHKPEYRETERFDLSICPVPDYSRIDPKLRRQFMAGFVQTSRGCPFDCEFCNVVIYMGHKMRYKPVETIIKEVEQLYGFGIKMVILADDNFSAGRQKAKDILRALRDWNNKQKQPVSFFTQVSIDVARDDEFLELAVAAGLTRVCIGIETSNEDSLKETNKLHNIKSDVLADVKKVQQHGIMIGTGCIVGFDSDDLSIFQRQLDFFMETGIPGIHVYPLQALDGTPLKTRLIKEGRYIDWDDACVDDKKYTNTYNTLTVIPKQMTKEQLQQGAYWLAWQLYSLDNFTKRVETFFNNFESSPKKGKLKINKQSFNIKALGLMWRLALFYFTKALPDEKAALRKMIKMSRKSSFPNSLATVIFAFLTVKYTRGMLQEINPEIARIRYPE